VVYEDDDLLIVDKPAGMPTQPIDEVGDVVTRLRASHIGYLGLLYPLDREMSGLLLLSKTRAQNAALADALGRGVPRAHLAVVSHVPRRVPGFSCEVVAQKGSRALLRLSSKAASQPVRRALAAVNAAVAGDTDNGGEPAPRLMLHHEAIELTHPESGRRLALSRPAPELEAWLSRSSLALPNDEAELALRIEAAIDRRWGIARRGAVDAFRLVNAAGDALPGVEIEIYGHHAVVWLRDEPAERASQQLLDALMRLDLAGIYLMHRPKKGPGEAPANAARGEDAPDPLTVHEAGVRYQVKLGGSLSTGLFLDQRKNRELVRSLAADKRVLNLFGYTGSFSVAAALGNAAVTVTVDASKPALARAAENLALNGADMSRHELVREDALHWLERASRRRLRFDIVILDPPSFSTTARSTFRAAHDYRRVATAAMRCLAPGGSLLACTNHRGIVARDLKGLLRASARELGLEVSDMRLLPDPVDFPPPPAESCHLKCVLCTTAS
jgi:23S rRNA (cytosine1962-C5)-methyltransferase